MSHCSLDSCKILDNLCRQGRNDVREKIKIPRGPTLYRYLLTLSSCFALNCLFDRLLCDGFGVIGVLRASLGRDDDDLTSSVLIEDPLDDDMMEVVRMIDFGWTRSGAKSVGL
jgi:hypothetical protein